MSIVAYTGLPRHGKSYSAVEQVVLPAVQKGRIVVTNLAVKKDVILRDYPRADIRDFPIAAVQADPSSIVDLVPNGAVCVLDEVWRLWPAGKKVDQIPEAFKSFLAEHGHRVDVAGNSQHIVLVTQDLAQIAAFARQLVEQTFLTVKLTSVGFSKKFRTDVYLGHPTGLTPPQQQRIRQIFGSYRPQVYQYYTSHTMSEAGEGTAANEGAMDRRGNALMRPLVMLSPLIIVGLVVGGLYGLRHSGLSPGRRPGGVAVRGGGVVPAVAAAEASPAASSRWRVSARFSGLCMAGSCGWAVLEDGASVEWVPLIRCRSVGPTWECPHGVAEVSEASAPRPSDARPLLSQRTPGAPGP